MRDTSVPADFEKLPFFEMDYSKFLKYSRQNHTTPRPRDWKDIMFLTMDVLGTKLVFIPSGSNSTGKLRIRLYYEDYDSAVLAKLKYS